MRNVLSVIAASRRGDQPEAKITFLAAAVATDWACFADKDGLLFRSTQDTADAVGASRKNVRDAVAQLLGAGLAKVSEVKKQTGKKSKGRDATSYRLLMVDVSAGSGVTEGTAISAPIGAKNEGPFSAPTGAKNEGAILAPVGASFLAPIGATTVEEPIMGAGARVNARPAPIPSVLNIDTEEDWSGRAPEGAPAPLASNPNTDPASDQWGEPVTLEELEQEVRPPEIDDDARDEGRKCAEAAKAVAEAALAELHGAALTDPADFVEDLIAGFVNADPLAARRAARVAVDLILAEPSRDERHTMWAGHREIVLDLVADVGADESAAWPAYHAAVAHAGHEHNAARRSAFTADETDEEAYG